MNPNSNGECYDPLIYESIYNQSFKALSHNENEYSDEIKVWYNNQRVGSFNAQIEIINAESLTDEENNCRIEGLYAKTVYYNENDPLHKEVMGLLVKHHTVSSMIYVGQKYQVTDIFSLPHIKLVEVKNMLESYL